MHLSTEWNLFFQQCCRISDTNERGTSGTLIHSRRAKQGRPCQIPKNTHPGVTSARFRSTCGMNFVATDPFMWCWIKSTHRGSCPSLNRWTWSHMWWSLMCKSRITGMNQSFSFFFDILLRLFDEEKRTLRANARSLTTRGILDTFYNYDQVQIYSDLILQRSVLVHLDGSLVATDGTNLSQFGILDISGKDLRKSRCLDDQSKILSEKNETKWSHPSRFSSPPTREQRQRKPFSWTSVSMLENGFLPRQVPISSIE